MLFRSDFLRISVGTAEENAEFLTELESVVASLSEQEKTAS